MINKKLYKSIVSILLLILLITSFFLAVLGIFYNFKRKVANDKQVFVFGAEPITADEYNNFDNFEVDSAEGFKTFIESMMGYVKNEGDVSAASNVGYNYEGKTITQTEDIEVKPFSAITNPYEFAGTYDGQGGTIDYNGQKATYDDNTYVGAFCTYLKGTVKNTRFLDACVAVNEKSGWFGEVYAGVVAGLIWSEGTIESCIVDWAAFESDVKPKYCYVGMFAGENKGTIKNCMTANTYALVATKKANGLYAGAFVGKSASGSSITNCIDTAEATDIYSVHIDNLNFPSDSQGAYSSCSSAWSSMKTDISDEGGENGSVWYKYATLSHGFEAYPYYNNGTTIYYYCVYLRVFIKSWTTRYFQSENTSKGTVNLDELCIPNESGYATGSWAGPVLTIYGKNVIATPNDSAGYDFNYWGVSLDGQTWTAYFKEKTYLLAFMDSNNTTTSLSNCKFMEQYTVKHGTTISVSFEENVKSGYKYVIISFVDSGGNTRAVTYTAEDTYYISDFALSTEWDFLSLTSETNRKIVAGGYICVMTSSKQYDVTIN